MKKDKITLKEATKFHGHLGPYLVLGLLAGEVALKKLKGKKYFGIEVKVWGANKKPKSCIIDGLQLSTGCTYGKGNISKIGGKKIEVLFYNLHSNKKIIISLKKSLIKILESLKGHRESQVFAKELLRINPKDLFDLKF